MDPERLDLRKLRAFQLVAEFGNLRQAATRLNITVSAVSFAIQRLERELDVILFDRMPNRMVLTSAGKRLARKSTSIFHDIETLLASLTQERPLSGSLAIAVSTDIGWLIAPQLKIFSALYPQVDLRVAIHRSSEALALVARGQVDLAIGRFRALEPGGRHSGHDAYKSLAIEPLIETGFSLVCPQNHPLAEVTNELSMQNIAQFTLVTIGQHNSARRVVESAFLKAGGFPRTIIEAINCKQVIDFVDFGLGVGIVHSICTSFAPCRLVVLPLDHHYDRIRFSALYKIGPRKGAAQSEAAAAMLTLLSSNQVTT